jgi:hypothetical protein
VGVLMLGFLFMAFRFSSRAECRTNVPFGDAIQFGDGPLAAPSSRFPYVAYILNTKYASFFNRTVSGVQTDECASDGLAKQADDSYNSARGKASLSSTGGKPDFRFRAQGTLGVKEASENISSVGVEGRFRFRDVVTLNNAGTSPVNVAITISMNGNMSLPISAIPVPQQQGSASVRLLVEDLTFCRPGPLITVNHSSQTQGPDYFETYVVSVCPTAILRIDLLVYLNATVTRFVQIGNQAFSGGYTYADYMQCVSGNSVCFEDCVDPNLEDCSGFSIRVNLVEDVAALSTEGAPKAAALQLVSAGGFDYSAPLPAYKPSLRVKQVQENAVVEWPSGASDWRIVGSANMTAWNTITNATLFDAEEMMFQLTWPLTNLQQFFRLEKPL